MLLANRLGQSGLWKYGISGDLPIVLLQISDPSKTELWKQVIQAHSYWRTKTLPVDLVILIEKGSSQTLHDQVISLIGPLRKAEVLDRPAGIFVRSSDQIPSEDLVLLESVARIALTDIKGGLGRAAGFWGKS